MIARLVFILIFAVCSATSYAQFATPQGVKVLGVEVEGTRFTDPNTVVALAGIQVGESIAPGSDKIQKAIKNLWRRQQFSSVNVIVDRVVGNGAFLKIVVEEYPRLNEITAVGNKEASLDAIRKAIGKYKGDIVTDYGEHQARKAVKKLYDEEGMPFAKVSIAVLPTDTAGYVRMNVTVEEGRNFYVSEMRVRGNEAFSQEQILGAFDNTHTKSWWQFWRSSKLDLKEYQEDKDKLLAFFRKNGHVDARLAKDTILYDDATGDAIIELTVDEGPKVHIRSITFEGNLVYPGEGLTRLLRFEPGDVYDKDRFEANLRGNEDQSDVASLYLNNGYLGANFQSEESRPYPDSVDITVRVVENDRFTIRRVEIVGNTKTHDKVIRRELYTRPGDYFNRGSIIRSVQGLGMLNYFNPEGLRPNVKPVPGDATKVDVVYAVEERSNDTFNASVGFAGAFGLTGSVGITLNNFWLGDPLSGGAGQIFNFNWQFGGFNLQTFTLGFTEPWLFNEPTTLGFNIFDSRQRIGFDFRQTGASLNIGRRFRWPDDFFRGDWIARFRRNDVGASTQGFRQGLSTELSIRQTFSRISIDNAIFPTEGSRFSFTTQWALGAIGIGTTDYLKNELNFEYFAPLLQIGGNNRMALRLRSTWGYIAGIQSDSTIPPIEAYFMGGNGLGGFNVTPLRGYVDRSIGPADQFGNQLGGQVQALHQLELRFAISLNPVPVYLLAFAEAGNVWATLEDTDPFDLKRSAGIGLRLLLNPIGLIGFDYAYGFDPVRSIGQPSGWQFHFQFGQ